MSGLAAARQLRSFGVSVTVLEAKDVMGGRVSSRKVPIASYHRPGHKYATPWAAEQSHYYALDIGAQVIDGLEGGNPMDVLTRQIGSDLHPLKWSQCPMYGRSGYPVGNALDIRVSKMFDEIMAEAIIISDLYPHPEDASLSGMVVPPASFADALSAAAAKLYPDMTEDERGMLQWHSAKLALDRGAASHYLDIRQPQIPFEGVFTGTKYLMKGGFAQVSNALADGLDVKLSTPVVAVQYTDMNASVQLLDGTILTADAVLLSVPLGPLKEGHIHFNPVLPDWKQHAIATIAVSHCIKVGSEFMTSLLNCLQIALQFTKVFWDPMEDVFGYQCPDSIHAPFLFRNLLNVTSQPVLVGYISGDAALACRSWADEAILNEALCVLQRIHAQRHPSNEPTQFHQSFPAPVYTEVIRWDRDPLTLGTTCFIPPGISHDAYDLMAAPVGPHRIFFAGEATHREHPGTVHGAVLSGWREATRIAKILEERAKPIAPPVVVSHPQYPGVPCDAGIIRAWGDDTVMYGPPIKPDEEHIVCYWANCNKLVGTPQSLLSHIRDMHLTPEQKRVRPPPPTELTMM